MCRHLLPRFDFPVTQALHGLGRLVVSHPASAIAVLLLPACVAFAVVAYRRVRQPSAGASRPARLGSALRRPSVARLGFGQAHPG